MNQRYRNQLPENFIVIGEFYATNQICWCQNSGNVYFWDHEYSQPDQAFYLVKEDIDVFLKSLSVSQENPPLDLEGIISIKLDF